MMASMASEQPPRAAAEPNLDPPSIALEVDGCILAHWHSVLVGVWAIPSTLEIVAEQNKIMEQLSAQGRKLSTIHLVIKRAPLPGPDVRSSYQALTRRFSESLACSAILLEGDGFWASAVRAFLTGVEMVARRVSSKTFGEIRPLVEWVASVHGAETGERINPEALRAVLEGILARPAVRKHRGASGGERWD